MAALAGHGPCPVDTPYTRPRALRLGLPVTAGRGWVEAEWENEGPAVVLDRATMQADPAAAAHEFRIYRRSDHELLANGGWSVSRTRPIRLIPVDATVSTGEGVLVRARVEWPEPVRLDVLLTWK